MWGPWGHIYHGFDNKGWVMVHVKLLWELIGKRSILGLVV